MMWAAVLFHVMLGVKCKQIVYCLHLTSGRGKLGTFYGMEEGEYHAL